eukprot:g45590.t1
MVLSFLRIFGAMVSQLLEGLDHYFPFFYSLEKRRGTREQLLVLLANDRSLVSDSEGIRTQINAYYAALFSQDLSSEDARRVLCENLPQVSQEDAGRLDAPVTSNELTNARILLSRSKKSRLAICMLGTGVVLSAYANNMLLTFIDPAGLGRMSECQAMYSMASSARINWTFRYSCLFAAPAVYLPCKLLAHGVECAALHSLRFNPNLTIKPADKGGAVVVWHTYLYIAEDRLQLSDTSSYQPLDHDPTPDNQNIISQTIYNLITSGELPPTATNLLIPQPRTARFYLLPKIHKPDYPGRPIVSACSCPTKHISTYLNSIFSLLVQELPTYISDTTPTLHLLQNIRFPSPQHLIFTMMSNEGVAMGTCMGPSYDCLFAGYVEQFLFCSYTETIPHLFLGYINDCIGTASCSYKELKQFIHFSNTFHPNLKFTWTISDTSLSF